MDLTISQFYDLKSLLYQVLITARKIEKTKILPLLTLRQIVLKVSYIGLLSPSGRKNTNDYVLSFLRPPYDIFQNVRH